MKQTNSHLNPWLVSTLFSTTLLMVAVTTIQPKSAIGKEGDPNTTSAVISTSNESDPNSEVPISSTPSSTSKAAETASSAESSQPVQASTPISNDPSSKATTANTNNTTSTITFKFVNATDQTPIKVDGSKTNISTLQTSSNTSGYTISTNAVDPTETKFTNKQAYVPDIPGFAYVGDINTLLPDSFLPGNYQLPLEYLPLADIQVNYVDIADPTKILWQYRLDAANHYVNDPYQTNYFQLPLNGYTFISVSDNASGTFQDTDPTSGNQPVQVTYYYQRTSSTAANNHLQAPKVKIPSTQFSTLRTGESYQIQPDHFSGYTLMATSGPFSGIMPPHAETAYEYYLPNMPVTVQYVDEATGDILDSTTLGQYNLAQQLYPEGSYASSELTFTGYKFDYVSGPATGTFDPINKTVTYYYKAVTQNAATVPIVINVRTPDGTLKDVIFLKGNIDTPIKPLLLPKLDHYRRHGCVIINHSIFDCTTFQTPLAQYTITVAQLVPQSSPLQRQAMPIIHEFGQTTPDNFAEVRSVPKAAFPKFDWSHVSLAVPTKNSETPITYRNELVRLARRFSGSNPDHPSVLATYFISLNGKINFGQRDESQSV